MFTRLFIYAWSAALVALPALCQPANAVSLFLTVNDNVVTAQNPRGVAVWKRVVSDASRLSIRPLAHGAFDLGDGTVVDENGRVVSHGVPTGPMSSIAATGPAWDPLLPLSTTQTYFSGPVFHPSGDAWALLVNDSFSAIQSNGVSGGWQTPHTLIDAANNGEPSHDVFNPKIAVASSGVVHVIYRGLYFNSTTAEYEYQLVWFSYTPGIGWQGPLVAYSSPYFFQEMNLATDSSNNLIVIFDRETSLNRPGAWSIVYSAATATWGQAQLVSPARSIAYAQTLAQNSNGSTILLVYLNVSVPRGIYSQRYMAATQTWSSSQRLPGTMLAYFSIAGVGTHYPLTVDSSGRGTLIAPLLPSIWGFRNEGGLWRAPTRLLPFANGLEDILNFGDAAVSSNGLVLGVNTSTASGHETLYAFRFTPGQGWNVETPAQFASNFITRSRIAWFDLAGQAIATYVSLSGLESVLNTSGAWSASPDIPGTYSTFYQETATAPSGEVLLLFDGSDGGGPATGVIATWLRP